MQSRILSNLLFLGITPVHDQKQWQEIKLLILSTWKKMNQELQEKHAKTQEDISLIMEILITLTKGKRNVEALNSQSESIPLRSVNDPLYPPGFTATREPQMAYPSQSQPVRMYPYLYVPPSIVQTSEPMMFEQPNSGVNLVNPVVVPDLDDPTEKEKLQQNDAQEKYELLEERLRAIEGINILERVGTSKLSLVYGLVIPYKFRTLEFDKYDGTKCPSTHLMMYCRKISLHTDNNKLLFTAFKKAHRSSCTMVS